MESGMSSKAAVTIKAGLLVKVIRATRAAAEVGLAMSMKVVVSTTVTMSTRVGVLTKLAMSIRAITTSEGKGMTFSLAMLHRAR